MMGNGKEHLHKQLIHAIANKNMCFPVAAEDSSLWEQEDLVKAVQARLHYNGYDFTVAEGQVSIMQLPDEQYIRLSDLKDTAYRYFHRIQLDAPKNRLIDLFIQDLKGFEEMPAVLLYHPYVAPGDQTVLFLAPTEEGGQTWSKQAKVDALIYDPDYQTYTKVKNMEYPYYDEVYLHGIQARTSLMHGGLMIWIREKVSIFYSGGLLRVVKGEVEPDNLFTKVEMEEALQECFGYSFKSLQQS